jgi:nucleotide-binding universal stress UspA family protein
MNLKSFLLSIALLTCALANAQSNPDNDKAYIATVTKRSDKILAGLQIADSAKYKQVKEIMVQQYVDLSDLEKDKNGEHAAQKRADLHKQFMAKLSAQLTPAQVEKIKDGMTYGVLPITYKAYTDMIPTLKEDEKAQIMSWLTEARELAMDGGSSEEKHKVFGKYKGRINNYLSSRGYDIQQERKNWEARQKASKTNG